MLFAQQSCYNWTAPSTKKAFLSFFEKARSIEQGLWKELKIEFIKIELGVERKVYSDGAIWKKLSNRIEKNQESHKIREVSIEKS